MNTLEAIESFGFTAETNDALEILDGFRAHLEQMYAELLTPAYIENDSRIRAAHELLELGDLHEVLRAANLLAQYVQEENELYELVELEEMNS